MAKRGLDTEFKGDHEYPMGKNYLFVIGINKYTHWPELNNAVRDIEDFTKVLLSRYQFRKEEVVALKDEEATEKKIKNKLTELAEKITENDNLILYFSGHGHYIKAIRSTYWIPVNAKWNKKNTNEHIDEYIDVASIVNPLKNMDTLHTLLIVDSCFSGTFISHNRSSEGLKDERYKSRKVLTSGRNETVEDGQYGGNSPFAKGILVTLTKNKDPHLRTSQLMVDVKNYVENQAKQSPANGIIYGAGDENGDFVFHLNMNEDEYWEVAREKNTFKYYKEYLTRFPKGKYVEKADKKIDEISNTRVLGVDIAEWEKAKKEDTYLGYRNFKKKYPNSAQFEAASHAMTRLDNLALNRIIKLQNKAKNKKEIIEACNQYFKTFPDSNNEILVKRIRIKQNY